MGKWVLHHGCHKGTLTSRDAGNPQEFDTHEAAMLAYTDHREFYHSIGYQIWFAELTDPDGIKKILESNPYY